MSAIERFLVNKFLNEANSINLPDGRLLHLYEWSRSDFWELVDLLIDVGPPDGYDFLKYRQRWENYRSQLRDSATQMTDFNAEQNQIELAWTIRGFVLYASEFWRQFKNDTWRSRQFHTDLPFEKLTWVQFLSLIGWESLYKGKVAGYIPVRDGLLHIAHTNEKFAKEIEITVDRRVHDRTRESNKIGNRGTNRSVVRKAYYPGLYFPILFALNWWQVAPIRLPTSIRYLDTFAHQGGAADRLVVECVLVKETETTMLYRPINPPHGYGIKEIPIKRASLPTEISDFQNLSITIVFGTNVDVVLGD